ncbi:MAG TPA: hypothetical protein VNK46_12895 [Nitrospiraceae bacterium]|nr:hypothetical protein [Nitrospiraceae bacterium]
MPVLPRPIAGALRPTVQAEVQRLVIHAREVRADTEKLLEANGLQGKALLVRMARAPRSSCVGDMDGAERLDTRHNQIVQVVSGPSRARATAQGPVVGSDIEHLKRAGLAADE